ncbi:Transcription factor MYB1R1 [Senna tora]|uniref:Transcription factor MYB1R1 n=1 Tax=Senna tora TaxID=362788 RepID=A0A834U011_9FABA|nr:Transcription factor MYB1R1 [Senna tora]
MADFEIIDLTDSPPSSPPPSSPPRSRSIRRRSRRILSFRASASSRAIIFKFIRRPDENPSSEYLTRHVVPWIPPTPTGQISQAVNELHSTMHGGEPQLFQPFPGNDPNMAAPVTTFLVTKHGEIWTQHEHEEFVKGLGNCGGCWERIASEFVMTKTAAEVESYAESFFRHLTQICLHSVDMFVEESSILTIPCAANAMMVEEPPTTVPPTLRLFPLTASRRRRRNPARRHPNPNVPAVPPQTDLDLELRLGPACSSIAYGEAEEIDPFQVLSDGNN